jgi:hypothetical protein
MLPNKSRMKSTFFFVRSKECVNLCTNPNQVLKKGMNGNYSPYNRII